MVNSYLPRWYSPTLFLALPLWAGATLAYTQDSANAAIRTLTCPLDGQTLTITATPGCAFTGQTMDGRPLTTCPDDTLLPDCTASGLPL